MPTKELIGASTIPLILTVLQSGDHYGYDLIKKVRQLSDGKLDWSEAMLYPVLHRMQRDGFIDGRWEKIESSRKRKYYAITEEGKKLLAEKREDWIVMIELFQKIWNLASGLS